MKPATAFLLALVLSAGCNDLRAPDAQQVLLQASPALSELPIHWTAALQVDGATPQAASIEVLVTKSPATDPQIQLNVRGVQDGPAPGPIGTSMLMSLATLEQLSLGQSVSLPSSRSLLYLTAEGDYVRRQIEKVALERLHAGQVNLRLELGPAFPAIPESMTGRSETKSVATIRGSMDLRCLVLPPHDATTIEGSPHARFDSRFESTECRKVLSLISEEDKPSLDQSDNPADRGVR